MIFSFLFKSKKNQTKLKKKTSPKSLSIAKKRASVSKAKKKPKEELIGKITHFFPRVSAGVIKLKKSLSLGDTIHIKGHTSDFIQKVSSLQINNKPVKRAEKGKLVGVLVKERVRRNDKVYKIKEK
ncbi:MAG TPA: translation elongation factor-like protein [Candidatus Omnitrophica bacterium]|nr:translation elongation factor-like protein [Candidatus Omnitrophota bacterium]